MTTPETTPETARERATESERARLVAAHEDAADFYRRTLLGPDGAGPRAYLTDRGFQALLEDTQWTVGYAPAGWTPLRDHLTALGYGDETLIAAGLTRLSRRGTPIDCFRDRITFGIRDADQTLVGFTARSAPDAPPHVPKYLNTNTTPIYDKSHTPFGLGEATAQGNGATALTEGPLDAIAIDLSRDTDHTPPRPLALCGTAITENHRRAIAKLGASEIILAFDDDEPGTRARERAYRVLRHTADLTATDQLDGADLAELHGRHGPTATRGILEKRRTAIDAIIDARLRSWPNRSENAEAAVACLRSLARLLRDLKPNDIAHHANRLHEATRLPTTVVTRELANAMTRP